MIREMQSWLRNNLASLDLTAIAAMSPLELYLAIENHYPGGSRQFELDLLVYEPRAEVEIKFRDGAFEAWAYDGHGSAYVTSNSFKDAFAQAIIFLNALMAGRRYAELAARTIPF